MNKQSILDLLDPGKSEKSLDSTVHMNMARI